ncbi:MAG: 30S ribosome-binding factor RbfA [bacterium]
MALNRIAKINALIKQEVGKFFIREIEFPKSVIVTIARVETTADLLFAKVWITILPIEQEPEVLPIIKDHQWLIQRSLNRTLVIKKVPELQFKVDKTEAQAARIAGLLDGLKNQE